MLDLSIPLYDDSDPVMAGLARLIEDATLTDAQRIHAKQAHDEILSLRRGAQTGWERWYDDPRHMAMDLRQIAGNIDTRVGYKTMNAQHIKQAASCFDRLPEEATAEDTRLLLVRERPHYVIRREAIRGRSQGSTGSKKVTEAWLQWSGTEIAHRWVKREEATRWGSRTEALGVLVAGQFDTNRVHVEPAQPEHPFASGQNGAQ